jgi:hypothetical protein
MSNFNHDKFTVMKSPSSIISDTIYAPYHVSESGNVHTSCEGKKDSNLFNGVAVSNIEAIYPAEISADSSFTKTCVDTADRHQGLEAAVFESATLQSSENRNAIGSMSRIAPATFLESSFSQIHQKGDRWKNSDRDPERSVAYMQDKQVANDVRFGLPCKSPNNYFIVASSGWSFPDNF